MGVLGEWLDGNWIDIGSLVVAVLYAYCKGRKAGAPLVSKKTATLLANGTSFFPLGLLGLSLFSSKLLQELLQANRVILSVAGICALLAMLDDGSPEQTKTGT